MIDAVVDASLEHIPFIAATARQPDVEECWKMCAAPVSEALKVGLIVSDSAKTWFVNGLPAAMGGIQRLGDNGGLVWLASTELVELYPRRFIIQVYVMFERWKKEYDYIFNYVSTENRRYIYWLKWMGYHFYEPEPYGPFRSMFCRFEWRKT